MESTDMHSMKGKAKRILKRNEKRLFKVEKEEQVYSKRIARGEAVTSEEFKKWDRLLYQYRDIREEANAMAEAIEELGIMTAMEIQWYRTTIKEGLRKNG